MYFYPNKPSFTIYPVVRTLFIAFASAPLKIQHYGFCRQGNYLTNHVLELMDFLNFNHSGSSTYLASVLKLKIQIAYHHRK